MSSQSATSSTKASTHTSAASASQEPSDKRLLCRSHPDFHIPADIVVGEGFDGDALGRQLKAAGADSIAIFAKCHYGHAYYPTEVGVPHPQLRCDLLGEAIAGCHAHGVEVTAYLSLFYDSAEAARHPEWIMHNRPLGDIESEESETYVPMCVNSSYIKESLIPQSIEVITKYDVNELFYDTMSWFRPCFCTNCQCSFGKEIPADDTHAHWPEFVAWYRQCFDDAFVEINTAVAAVRPEVNVIFNWKWGVREPTSPPQGISHLSADYWGSGRISSYISRYLASTGLSYDYMCGRFMHGLGDWDSSTDETLLYTASGAIANGANYYIIDRMLPNGSLEPRSYEVMKTVFDHINVRRQYLEGASVIADIAVLHSYDSIIGSNCERFADFNKRKEEMKTSEGVGQILMEGGRHYTGISEQHLQEHIQNYRLLIMPEQAVLAEETVAAVRRYIEAGGHVIMSMSNHGTQENICALAGIKYQGMSTVPYTYIGTEKPFHIKSAASMIETVDAEVRTYAKVPMALGGEQAVFGHGLAPYTQEDGDPIITRRRLGKGSISVIATPISAAYVLHRNPHSEALIMDMIDEVIEQSLVRIETKARVEMSLYRKDQDLIIHLVNHSGKETISSWVFPMIDYLPDIHDIKIQVRVDGSDAADASLGENQLQIIHISNGPSEESIAYTIENGYAHFVAPCLQAMSTIVVHNYYKNSLQGCHI